MSYPKYGQAKHPIYIVWRGMQNRCTHENDRAYADYGGRGIKRTTLSQRINAYGWSIEEALTGRRSVS